ncbi:antibiotic biosynthesis monooxygenase family protein [Goodfellowiella coeruleoviolacea]|uniref:Antibiotic biosynthesis monooxygenase n=1 Tax=Goodfellowiella coeruleoviolacea TaxID=334858 RepID=A0AAE3KIG5_9PSEU|nr:antibiotic biosynthesis monooxygenase family protein [Goodfellowiella coeruleoviolacea]MCP2168470.1 Antibiotic biosynthesis monooxygenase [Goodfellowiella coeruleoviolacea]
MSSPTTTITVDADLVTLVNVFTVDPARQAELVNALDEATRRIFVAVPGFISANLHASLDGTRVINYAQWASERHHQEALRRADVREHLTEATAIAEKWDPTLVRVRSIHHPQRQSV